MRALREKNGAGSVKNNFNLDLLLYSFIIIKSQTKKEVEMKRWSLVLLLIVIPLLGDEIFMGIGSSTKGTPQSAVKEAYSTLPKKVTPPDLCIVFSTVEYSIPQVVNSLRNLTGPRTKIFGATSCVGVITPEGFIIGKNGSLAIMAIKTDQIKFGVSGVAVTEKKSGFDAGKEAITKAIKNAGKKGKTPKIILISTTPGIEEDALKGIESIVGTDVPIIGGSAADNEIIGEWKVIANNKVYNKGVVLTAIYTDLKIGYSFVSGYKTMDKQGVATKTKGRTIYEINNRLAGEVYNEWCEGNFSEQLKTGDMILGPSAFTPLARKVVEKGKVKFISIHPARINPEDHSLDVFAEVNEGDSLFTLKGNPEILLSRPRSVGMAALQHSMIKPKEIAGGILIYCAGTMLPIKDELGEKGFSPLTQLLDNRPFIGAFTFGEQGFYKGIGSKHGNLMASMIIFGKE